LRFEMAEKIVEGPAVGRRTGVDSGIESSSSSLNSGRGLSSTASGASFTGTVGILVGGPIPPSLAVAKTVLLLLGADGAVNVEFAMAPRV
jgi:hypothetical protein